MKYDCDFDIGDTVKTNYSGIEYMGTVKGFYVGDNTWVLLYIPEFNGHNALRSFNSLQDKSGNSLNFTEPMPTNEYYYFSLSSITKVESKVRKYKIPVGSLIKIINGSEKGKLGIVVGYYDEHSVLINIDDINYNLTYDDKLYDEFGELLTNSKFTSNNHIFKFADDIELVKEKTMENKPIEQPKLLVFGKFNIGDIVVSLTSKAPIRAIGQMFKVLPMSDKSHLYYQENNNSIDSSAWRLATPEEVKAFESGIKNINDIKELLVFGKFEIGQVVVNLVRWPDIRKEGDIFKVLEDSKEHRLYYKENNNSSDPSQWRAATPEEIEAFEKGITNINDIKPSTFKVGDEVIFSGNGIAKRIPTGETWKSGKGTLKHVISEILTLPDGIWYKTRTITDKMYTAEAFDFYNKQTKEMEISGAKSLVLGKYHHGDIIVSLECVTDQRKIGDIFKVLENSTTAYLYYKSGPCSTRPDSWRIATSEEVEAYNKGIRHIKDISPVKKDPIPKFKIGDKVITTINGFEKNNPTIGDWIGIVSVGDYKAIVTEYKYLKNIFWYKLESLDGYKIGNWYSESALELLVEDTKPTLKFKLHDKVKFNGKGKSKSLDDGGICSSSISPKICEIIEIINHKDGIWYKVDQYTYRIYDEESMDLYVEPKTEIKQEKMKYDYKFKVGDIVKVVRGGTGCSSNDVDGIVQITELGEYKTSNPQAGYKVSPAIGNTKNGEYNGFIGEESFELYTPEKSLIEQAKERYPEGCYIRTIITNRVEGLAKHSDIYIHYDNKSILFKNIEKAVFYLYHAEKNQWAEIVPDPTTATPITSEQSISEKSCPFKVGDRVIALKNAPYAITDNGWEGIVTKVIPDAQRDIRVAKDIGSGYYDVESKYFKLAEEPSKVVDELSTDYMNSLCEYKIGDRVIVVKHGKTYTSYGTMFRKLKFKNTSINPTPSNGDTGIIFGITSVGTDILLAINLDNGRQILIHKDGVEKHSEICCGKSEQVTLHPVTAEPLVWNGYPIVTTDNAKVGLKVRRGRDWKWEDQDGNSAGTIVSVSSKSNDYYTWCRVKWDNTDKEYTYRISKEYDLIIDLTRQPILTPEQEKKLDDYVNLSRFVKFSPSEALIPYYKLIDVNLAKEMLEFPQQSQSFALLEEERIPYTVAEKPKQEIVLKPNYGLL